ncbi:uncharacterized protein LOC143240837 isoform X2 [Tachypleus tridentatus]|uniref:uncharacterized protein LOC143240837 isoform X2 n=1 Tax=Tachypleus tridentatus TaxID=6853 RepID=UPI003FD5C908
MEFQQTDFQFLDLNDIPEKEANEICGILNCAGDNLHVELPWKDETPISNLPSAAGNVEHVNEDLSLACCTGHDTRVFPQVSNVNTTMTQPFLPTVTSISYLPEDQSYLFVPRNYPVIPQYLGVPLFTQNIPQQDLNTGQAYHYQIPYPQPILSGNNFTTVACGSDSDKVSDGQDLKQNGQICEKQYPRRNRKKHPFNCYSLEMCMNSDPYQTGSMIFENQLTNVIPLNDFSILSHNPVVPFNVPPPNYSLTTGTTPLPGIVSDYPNEITTMQYSPMVHPQAGPAPVFCVPVISSPYHGYINLPTALPSVHQVMDGSQNYDVYLPLVSVCVTASEVYNGYSYCETTLSSDTKTTVVSIDNSVNSCIKEHNIYDSAAKSQTMQSQKIEVETNVIPDSEWRAGGQSFTPTPITSEPEVEVKTDCMLGDVVCSDVSSCSSELSTLSVKLTEKIVVLSDRSDVESKTCKPTSETGYMSSPISTAFDEAQSVSTPEHLDQDSGVSLPSNDEVETSVNSGLQQRQSWADLFKMMSLENRTIGKENPVNDMMLSSVMSHRTSDVTTDVKARKIAKILTSLRLNHAAPFLIPRGLINCSNWCCVNAILQALLVCPPLYNLLKRLPRDGSSRSDSSTLVTDSLVCFMNEFPPMPYGSKRKRKDLTFGKPFEPSYVYSLVSLLNSSHIEGCLEDADDVLNFLLCGLHEEMDTVINVFRKTAKGNSNACEVFLTNGHATEYQENGPNTKSNVIKSSHSFHSPIFDIFGGQITSTMTVGNETSTSSHHFFSLTVDIQAEDVCQVSDALAYITPTKLAHGYTPEDSKGGNFTGTVGECVGT